MWHRMHFLDLQRLYAFRTAGLTTGYDISVDWIKHTKFVQGNLMLRALRVPSLTLPTQMHITESVDSI